jgi:hypothetical protein
MHPSQRRTRPRTPRPGSEPNSRRTGRRSLAILAVAGAIGLGTGGVVAARDPAGSPSTIHGSGRPSTSATVAAGTASATVPETSWLAQRGDGTWVLGRGERGVVRRLPAGEAGLAIDDRFVASVLAGTDGRSVVRFRDVDSGRATRDVVAPIWVSAGSWTPAGLVVTGYGDASMATDGGLVLIAPDDGTVTPLVEASPFSPALGRAVARGEVLVSPSGATVASNVCGVELCDLQVVELTTGRVSRPIRAAEGFLRAVTDDAVVTTDDGFRWISARRIADGVELWRERDTALVDPVALADGSIAGLVGSSRAGWAIAAIDRTGGVRDLTARRHGDQPPPRIWRAMSTGEALVVGLVPFEEALESGAPSSVTVLTPGGGPGVSATIHLPTETEAVP